MTTAVLVETVVFTPTAGINDLAFDRALIVIPAGGFEASSGLAGAATPSLPTPVEHTTHTGDLAPSFALTDWYFRIHVTPAQLSLGNVVSNEVFTIGVWNAWLATSQTLDSIGSVGAVGVTLTGQPPPPLVYAPNEQKNYTLSVDTQGPPTIDAVFTFVFHDGESVTLTAIGQRITAWALTPDWSNGVNEKVGFLTDVLTAWSGKEQRRALRIAPRRKFAFSTFMQGQEKRFIENAMFSWTAQIWALPIFPDGQYLAHPIAGGDTAVTCDTVNRDFVAGGLAMVLTNAANYEVLQVDTVSSGSLGLTRTAVGNWGIGSKLYPVRASRMLTNPRFSRDAQQLASISPEFTVVEPCDWPAATGLPTYRGLPVLEDSPDMSKSNEAGYAREANITDYSTGAMEVDDTAQLGFPSNAHQWYLRGRSARAAFRSLLYLLKGRQGEIWVPSYDADMLAVSDISSSTTTITCEAAGVALYAAVQNRQDIRIELLSGAVFYRRVTGATAGGPPNTEVVSIDSSLGVTVSIKSIRRISWMALSKLDADEIEIQHLTAIDGLATATTPFVAVNDNV